MNFLKNIIYSLYFFTNLIIWLKVFKIHSNKNNTNLKYVTSKKNLYVLRKLVKEDGEVSVSRVWLREAQEERKAKSINFALDVPKAKPEYSMPTTRPIEKKKMPQVTIDHNDKKDPVDIEDDEYEPPPLFASDAGVTNY